ncbi:MAG TPA: helix-turn-helix domain-containing protein [Candidatus Acidoferrales bacterium]
MERNLPELLRVTEVAERLGLRASTIRAWILHRRIEAVRVGRRAIRISAAEVARIIVEGTISARRLK